MLVYEMHFEFRVREGWPSTGSLIAFRKTGDEALWFINAMGKKYLTHIQLTEIEDDPCKL